MKNIKRIQNQLNYLTEYAKKLARKEESEDKPKLDTDNNEINEETEEYVDSYSPSKLSKNEIRRMIDLESVTNSMSEGLIIYSMDMEVILINPAMAQMLLPYNPRGTGRLILNPDDSLFFERCINPIIMEKIQRALLEEPTVPRSDILELKNPKQVLKRYSAPLYDNQHNQIGHVIIYHDISVETEIEELRKDFISNASHELRTPVTSLKVLIESLMGGAKDDPKLLNEFLKDVSLEINRLHQLVNDLLDIAKMEAEKNSLQISEFELNSFLSEILSSSQPLARSREIKLSYIDFEEIVIIKADRRKLRQVFVNLVTNAIKFTPAKGEVKIVAKKQESEFEFKICDTGIGIPDEDQPHIFDKFYRVNKERSRIIGGSGLGLTIVKHIIDGHKGTIHVKSKPGNTIFTFIIPQ